MTIAVRRAFTLPVINPAEGECNSRRRWLPVLLTGFRGEGGEGLRPVVFSTQRPGRVPQRRPLRAPWVRIRGAATTAMSLHRRGAATKKAGTCRRNPPMEAKCGRNRRQPVYGHSLPWVGPKPRSGAVTLRADGLAWGRALGHSALLSAGRAPRGEKPPPAAE